MSLHSTVKQIVVRCSVLDLAGGRLNCFINNYSLLNFFTKNFHNLMTRVSFMHCLL